MLTRKHHHALEQKLSFVFNTISHFSPHGRAFLLFFCPCISNLPSLQDEGHALQPQVFLKNQQTTEQGKHMAKNSSATAQRNPPPLLAQAQAPGTGTSTETGSKDFKPHRSISYSGTQTRHSPARQHSPKAQKAHGNHSAQLLPMYLNEQPFFQPHLPPQK